MGLVHARTVYRCPRALRFAAREDRSTRTSRGRYPFFAAQFQSGRAKLAWLADLNYVSTWSGWVYIAVVLDVCAAESSSSATPRTFRVVWHLADPRSDVSRCAGGQQLGRSSRSAKNGPPPSSFELRGVRGLGARKFNYANISRIDRVIPSSEAFSFQDSTIGS